MAAPKKKKAAKKNGKTKPILVVASTKYGKKSWVALQHTTNPRQRLYSSPFDTGWDKAVAQDRKAKRKSTVSVLKGTGKKAWGDSKAKRDARGWAKAKQRSRAQSSSSSTKVTWDGDN